MTFMQKRTHGTDCRVTRGYPGPSCNYNTTHLRNSVDPRLPQARRVVGDDLVMSHLMARRFEHLTYQAAALVGLGRARVARRDDRKFQVNLGMPMVLVN